MSRTIEAFIPLGEAQARILEQAAPGEPTEVSLAEAVGLVLAEAAIADVDLPPSDRAACEGYAVRSAGATAGVLLRVAGSRWARAVAESPEAGEAVRVAPGDALPVGVDAVIRPDGVRPDPDPVAGRARVVEVLRGVVPGRDVIRRGSILAAGTTIARQGTRLDAPMVGLLASQGCVHPVCHRRVRVAIVAVGDHLIGASEAPTMGRERNAAGAAVVALALRAGAMPHDFQAVARRRLIPALERATSAPAIVVLGPLGDCIPRAFAALGVEPILRGVAVRPGGYLRYGVIRDDDGRVAHHVFHLPLAPIDASIAFTLLVRPLIARLQGDPEADAVPRPVAAIWEGHHRPSGNRARPVLAAFEVDSGAHCRVRPVASRGPDDLPALARAHGIALLPARSGPWTGGEVVDFVRFD